MELVRYARKKRKKWTSMFWDPSKTGAERSSLCLLHFEQLVLSKIPLRQDRTAEQLMPALDHLARRPGIGQCLVHVRHGVAMAGHERVAADIDGKDLRQRYQRLLDPAPAVLEGASGECILAAQEGGARRTQRKMQW